LQGDFGGDGRTDLAIYRPSTGLWLIPGLGIIPFGAPGDIPATA
jgi:hypothetical protein